MRELFQTLTLVKRGQKLVEIEDASSIVTSQMRDIEVDFVRNRIKQRVTIGQAILAVAF